MSLPPVTVPTGAIRYNTDSNKMECFNGTKWMQVSVSSPDLGGNGNASTDPTGISADKDVGVRGITAGGVGGDSTWDTINYFNISTTGNAIDFGNLAYRQYLSSGTASRTRGIFMGGYTNSPSSTYINSIQCLEIESTGSASDFGNLSQTAGYTGTVGNQIRGVRLGGTAPANPATTTTDYVTIATKGDAEPFGTLGHGTTHGGNINSSTRGIVAVNSDSYRQIEFITIPTTGNSVDFGQLSKGRGDGGGMSNPTRGIFTGGYQSPGLSPHMDYVTISTTGKSTEFGDLSLVVFREGNASSPTRGIISGGMSGSPWPGRNEIQYVQFATQGNTVDFGNLTITQNEHGSCSNGHGGL
mgnify:CR=1 FL=1